MAACPTTGEHGPGGDGLAGHPRSLDRANRSRHPPWHDNESLASHSLQQSPDSPSLHLVLAWRCFLQNHDLEGAQSEYETALRLNGAAFRPMSTVTYEAVIGLGQVAGRKGRFEEAVRDFRHATRIAPISARRTTLSAQFTFRAETMLRPRSITPRLFERTLRTWWRASVSGPA
jgi:tetratricopeptide (TPR) repeat protein